MGKSEPAALVEYPYCLFGIQLAVLHNEDHIRQSQQLQSHHPYQQHGAPDTLAQHTPLVIAYHSVTLTICQGVLTLISS